MVDPLTDLHELEAAEARRRAEYEQRHAELVRDASRCLGKARLSKSAGASPVLAPIGHSDQSMMFMPEGTGTSPIHVHTSEGSGALCVQESGTTGVPLPPSCHHDECQKSYRKALKASRRFSGPSLPPVPSFSLDTAATSPGTVSNLPMAYHSGAVRTHPQYCFRARSGSPSHMHSYSPYPRVSPPTVEKERDSYVVIDSTSPVGGSSSSSLSDSLFSAPIYGISSQPGISNERSTSGPTAQAQYTPSASPFLRPLQSLGLDSPSVSPKMEQSALGMLASSDAHIGDIGFLDTAGIRTYEPALGKRRDSSTTVTHHDFSRARLRAVLPQVKSESTPTSPTWRYFHRPIHGSSISPPPTTVDAGTTSTSSSPPSPALHSHSLPHTPHLMRGQPPHHHHLAHSVRMAFAMTPIKQLDSGFSPPHQPQIFSPPSQSIPHPSISSSSSIHNIYKPAAPGPHFSYSRSSSRSGSPPIMLPPLSTSTPNSTATVSSRAPSPTSYITLPPLKVNTAVGSVKSTGHVPADEALGISGDGASILTTGDSISNPSSATPGERITLPGFSELIRAADS
jgi:zinc-finger protein CreA/MIG